MPGRANRLQKDLSSNGYIVIREVLTPEQVKRLRLAVTQYLKSGGQYKYGGKFQLHAMYVVEEVAKLLTSDTILNRLKEITHPLEVVLTGECDLMINTTSSWHHDVPHHRASLDGSIFSDESFRVYKIAFYLQDQDENSRATLKIRPRSHLKALNQSMPEKAVAVRAGDAIVFDVRIEHAGQMPTLVDRAARRLFERIAPRLRLDAQKAFTLTRSIIRWIGRVPDRVAIFMTFGPPDAWTYSYVEEGRKWHPGVRGTLSPEVLTQLAVSNVAPPLIGKPYSSHQASRSEF
ncbi:phytanoyl-CoA dioxygenase family protein [Rhizobium sp. P32RR-XVIII]|uniref:phytanoyl-CoA dioxygenase family protein n=1 Tax=Rhizobium sp. P32RR-XVIII TaxID=2726738 RepID=UPI0028AB22B2|nr:phytanoyl-CoA dioxygenase family protein [Rhizobium sp. P32RR-XVIII]